MEPKKPHIPQTNRVSIIPTINQTVSVNTRMMMKKYEYRNLGWENTENIKFLVESTNGSGNCFVAAVYQAIGKLSNLPQDCLFLRDTQWLTKLIIKSDDQEYNMLDINYNDEAELKLIFPRNSFYDAREILLTYFRYYLATWLANPYFDGEKYTTEHEAIEILNSNVDNIRLWFKDKFLNPNIYKYVSTYQDASIFLSVIFYADNIQDEDVLRDKLKIPVIDAKIDISTYIENNMSYDQIVQTVTKSKLG